MARRELRERILDAAAQVLREGGPRPRLITTIAERAQVSRPTLYRHFPAREDLYESLMRVELERVIDDIAARAVQTSSPREDYVDMVVDVVREAREHAALRAVLARHPEILAVYMPRLLPIVLEIAVPRLGPIVEERVREGRWPAIDTRAAITWTTRLIASFLTMPLPEDANEPELRLALEALLDVTHTIAAAATVTPR